MTVIADAWLKPTGHQNAVAEGNGGPASTSVVVVGENPIRDRLRFTVKADTRSRVSAALYDILGRKAGDIVLSRIAAGLVGADVQVGNLPAGIYWLRVGMDGKAYVGKVVKLN